MGNVEIIKIAIFILIGLVVLLKILPKKMPKEKNFVCARCSRTSPYTKRTIEAWRRGFSKLYCSTCHEKWLQTRPKVQRANSAGGCLSGIVLFIMLPPTVFIFLKWFI